MDLGEDIDNLNKIKKIQRFAKKKFGNKSSSQNETNKAQNFIQFDRIEAESDIEIDRQQRVQQRKNKQSQNDEQIQNQDTSILKIQQPSQQESPVNSSLRQEKKQYTKDEDISNIRQISQNEEIDARIVKNYIERLKEQVLKKANQIRLNQIQKIQQNKKDQSKVLQVSQDSYSVDQDQQSQEQEQLVQEQELSLKEKDSLQKEKPVKVETFIGDFNEEIANKQESNNNQSKSSLNTSKSEASQELNLSEIKKDNKQLLSQQSQVQINEMLLNNLSSNQFIADQNIQIQKEVQFKDTGNIIYNFLNELSRLIIQSKTSPKNF